MLIQKNKLWPTCVGVCSPISRDFGFIPLLVHKQTWKGNTVPKENFRPDKVQNIDNVYKDNFHEIVRNMVRMKDPSLSMIPCGAKVDFGLHLFSSSFSFSPKSILVDNGAVKSKEHR